MNLLTSRTRFVFDRVQYGQLPKHPESGSSSLISPIKTSHGERWSSVTDDRVTIYGGAQRTQPIAPDYERTQRKHTRNGRQSDNLQRKSHRAGGNLRRCGRGRDGGFLTSTTLPAFIFLLPGVFLLREWWGPPARGSRWDAAQLHRRAENAYRRTRKPAVAARRK